MPRWTSFLQCLSSVASESAVPKDLKIFSKGMMCGTRVCQARQALGRAGVIFSSVMKVVRLWTVRSESLRAAEVPSGKVTVGGQERGC